MDSEGYDPTKDLGEERSIEGVTLPPSHLRGMEFVGEPSLEEVARNVFSQEVTHWPGLQQEWTRVVGDDASERAFIQAYKAYVSDPLTLYARSPAHYQFLKEHVFYGREYLERQNLEQTVRCVEALEQMEALRPEVWERLNLEQRLEALQEVEYRLAEVQGRPPVEVVAEAMDHAYGSFDQQYIRINAALLRSDDVAQVVDTVAHEGRHAYQWYTINHPETHHDPDEVALWTVNWFLYMDAETYGYELYRSQPIEADAHAFGEAIRKGLYSS